MAGGGEFLEGRRGRVRCFDSVGMFNMFSEEEIAFVLLIIIYLILER